MGGFDSVANTRNIVVVLDGYSYHSSSQATWNGIQRSVRIRIGIHERDGNVFDFFPDVREILLALHEAGIPIALASSTWAPSLSGCLILSNIEVKKL